MEYEVPEEMKVPVTIITGFLGAGKTTLLNHILTTQHGMKFAVIENEYGEVGIDADLVAKKEQVAEEIIAMDNGCMCCSVREDLVKTIRKLLALGKKFDGILIETTGMADPGPVIQTLISIDDLRRRIKVDGVITVVDTKHCAQHLFNNSIKGTEAVNECQQQIAFADRIILNKIDLVSAEELTQLKGDISHINKLADMIEAEKSVVDVKKLIGIEKFKLERVLEFDPDFLKDADPGHEHSHASPDEGPKQPKHEHRNPLEANVSTRHDLQVSSVGIKLEQGEELQLMKLKNFISQLVGENEADLYRYKGIIAVKGFGEKFIFQGVHQVFDGNFAGEWEEPEGKRVSKFVFIGRNLDRTKLEEGFRACIAPVLRFKIGSAVEARIKGGWKLGKIIKTWDQGNPYRIKIEATGVEVFGPLDDDRVVRTPEDEKTAAA